MYLEKRTEEPTLVETSDIQLGSYNNLKPNLFTQKKLSGHTKISVISEDSDQSQMRDDTSSSILDKIALPAISPVIIPKKQAIPQQKSSLHLPIKGAIVECPQSDLEESPVARGK